MSNLDYGDLTPVIVPEVFGVSDMNEVEKTCENCEYELEDMEGMHCRHCIHNAEEKFKQKAYYEKKIECIDDVIERLLYKANNIKAKLEPSYFTECIDYLKTLPRVEEEQEIRTKVIDEFEHKLFEASYDDYESDKLVVDYSDVIEIAEKMKGE